LEMRRLRSTNSSGKEQKFKISAFKGEIKRKKIIKKGVRLSI